MKQNDAIKQAFEYNRQGVEAIFDAAEKVQVKAEELTGEAIEKAPLVPDQVKELIRKGIETGRGVRAGIREAVLKGHERLEKLIIPA
ncbi:hypothetical protein JCM14469_40450 [Desulfatiferula olefinivorans]